MINPHARPPHAETGPNPSHQAPNAALLIDFDNVTMGMRSDLARELKNLLDSDIIKGKVTVQRAYADWRRYPQYIVPLSEASIDLIFAPAYGSSKKNATDIRMAIDGMELVFIRPEIGTFILLTGDSDFSSLVLKLKEYGKYVIGIGIQESTSDILVQNCDEYYSYAGITGLSKTTGGDAAPDAWDCVEEAVQRMVARGDVMRSDRLKQVMMDLSPGFNERGLGFKSFTRFLVEAANKGLLEIRRGQNGQYDIMPRGKKATAPASRGPAANGNGQRGRKRRQPRPSASEAASREQARAPAADAPAPARNRRGKPDPAPALKLLVRAVGELSESNSAGGGNGAVRDSEVKRRMLDIDRGFNEGAFGFGKFSRFLAWAESEGAVRLGRGNAGSFEVRLAPASEGRAHPGHRDRSAGTDDEPAPSESAAARRRASSPGKKAQPRPDEDGSPIRAKILGLPTSESAIKRYLAHRYKGVGIKTAEKLVEAFGSELFEVLQAEPERVRKVLVRVRAESVLTAWELDYRRRADRLAAKKREARREAAAARDRDAAASSRGARDGAKGEAAPAVSQEAGANPESAAGADPAGADREEEPLLAVSAVAEGMGARPGLLGRLGWGRRKRKDEDG